MSGKAVLKVLDPSPRVARHERDVLDEVLGLQRPHVGLALVAEAALDHPEDGDDHGVDVRRRGRGLSGWVHRRMVPEVGSFR